ncbi:hypothetical protein ASPWEDRAFT_36690 [Aspergillus wentii DTO 134E9]|uniref:Uncharacterized protein n=1 Tax=Aspergillus wentii DTO 134E9 TaxID=1073089 RepID=A0A1L9RVL4_ASPWE|nr:uncharacterized protein ASPWEDRAFT_36690 [Aspergillus wentii DTO 134E9]OJJ38980.1 hypothetical protein ASPWEDRAFT_36690 [Aspergillus wentii DTO 134E9]
MKLFVQQAQRAPKTKMSTADHHCAAQKVDNQRCRVDDGLHLSACSSRERMGSSLEQTHSIFVIRKEEKIIHFQPPKPRGSDGAFLAQGPPGLSRRAAPRSYVPGLWFSNQGGEMRLRKSSGCQSFCGIPRTIQWRNRGV